MLDKDLASIQETRDLLRKATAAQKKLSQMSQEQIDSICKAIAKAGFDNREELAKMAVEETGFGKWQDKVIKNEFASKRVFEAIKNMKTVGVLREDKEQKLTEIGVPIGVIAALIPSTNPTSTVIYKSLIALKAGNAIVFSPHPAAKNCIHKTVDLIRSAAVEAGCPADAISVQTTLTMSGTEELMKSDLTKLILATGGSAMVKAAYSSGRPAIGVGPGNGPAYIETSADIATAVKNIIESKTFDNGTICSSEQSIITDNKIKDQVIAELKKQKAYFLDKEESARLAKFILRDNGTMNPQIVGKDVATIAKLANLHVPNDATVLIAPETRVGNKIPYSREKLGPILAFYTVDNWQDACRLCCEILTNEGAGHTMTIHSQNDDIIKAFALEKPVSRLLVNTLGTLGGIGATTNLFPALTLGCGAVGGSSTSDNISPLNLINIKRVVQGVRTMKDIRGAAGEQSSNIAGEDLSKEQLINLLVERVINKLNT
ncbi:acetaldehyde dehydrogenase (acetylating) [Streptococcus devriesei]|uniref:acetaldehyde dehydrogenase (acetylating) n=1 Tax=Streptococcus devriesei TaxID=231233 RepID=UPI0004021423|nr:acetaldehyde dehydrogenase (acetylating) [Streptococcus devriesei]